jgi:CheY-like chemotaxis protein
MTAGGTNLLIIEDDPAEASLIVEVARQVGPGVTIQVARDGVEALDLLHRPDDGEWPLEPGLVLLDLKLPLMSGLEVIGAIRAHPATKSLPIVVFTASALASDVDASYAAGANGYVVKPISYDELTRQVLAILAFWIETNCVPSTPRD